MKRRLDWYEWHAKAVREEAEKLQTAGYRVILVDRKPFPDMIALKDMKVIAVEVESEGYPSEMAVKYAKYDQPHQFDDVIWIVRTDRLKNMADKMHKQKKQGSGGVLQ